MKVAVKLPKIINSFIISNALKQSRLNLMNSLHNKRAFSIINQTAVNETTASAMSDSMNKLKDSMLPSALLSKDLLYRLDNKLPETSEEYEEIITSITAGTGIFPGDTQAIHSDHYLSKFATYSEHRFMPPKHFTLESGEKKLQVERLAPYKDLPGAQNRVIFDFDLISQTAIKNTLNTRGSYDRSEVYLNRFFNTDIAFIIREGSLPVGLITISHHVISIDIKMHRLTELAAKHLMVRDGIIETPYFWVHGGLFSTAGQGLANSLVFQLFAEELLKCKNQYIAIYDEKEKRIDAQQGLIYILGHSDKVPPFHIWQTYFRPIRTGLIRDTIIEKAFQHLTPEQDRATAFFDLKKGVDKSSANPLNSYKRDTFGKVIIPEYEQALSSFAEFKAILGDKIGEHAIYFLSAFDEAVLKNIQERFNKRNIPIKTNPTASATTLPFYQQDSSTTTAKLPITEPTNS